MQRVTLIVLLKSNVLRSGSDNKDVFVQKQQQQNKISQPLYVTLNLLSTLGENIIIYHDNMIDQVMSCLRGLFFFLYNHLCRS